MPGSSSKPSVIRFGLFEIDLRSRRLAKQGRLIRLQGQPLQLLELLLQKPHELVTREEIRQNLWPGDTFVEFDDSVNHAVRKLREALGDTAEKACFVETVPRLGYRFIAPVQLPNDEARPPKIHWRWSGFLLWCSVVGSVALISTVVAVRILRVRPVAVHAIAVLPLQNLSGDPGQEYFSDGITEAIITELGRSRGIRVISHQSVMRFKGDGKSLPQIARELGTDALVEGGVVRSGNRVRITAQLVAANPERHLWASSYESNAADILSLQREVAHAIAREIRASLSVSDFQKSGIDPHAYELYLRGREQLNSFNFVLAAGYLEQAVSLAPDYAPGHSSLAIAYDQLGFLGGMSPAMAAEKARQAAGRALTLDPQNAEAHTAAAFARFIFDWDWAGPDRDFRRAIELNPNSPDAHLLYSIYLTLNGRFDQAIGENQTAISLDPLNPFVNFNLGWTYAMAKRTSDGIAFMHRLQQSNPEFQFSHHHLAYLYALEGKCAEALAETEDHEGIDSAFQYAKCGRRRDALRLLRRAQTEVTAGTLDATYPAWINAVLGNTEEAFRDLDHALSERATQIVFIKVMPEIDSLRSDPRFEQVLNRAHVK